MKIAQTKKWASVWAVVDVGGAVEVDAEGKVEVWASKRQATRELNFADDQALGFRLVPEANAKQLEKLLAAAKRVYGRLGQDDTKEGRALLKVLDEMLGVEQ